MIPNLSDIKKYAALLSVLLSLAACQSWDFTPYDYDKHKSAKVKHEKADCEIKIKDDKPCIEWKWPFK